MEVKSKTNKIHLKLCQFYVNQQATPYDKMSEKY